MGMSRTSDLGVSADSWAYYQVSRSARRPGAPTLEWVSEGGGGGLVQHALWWPPERSAIVRASEEPRPVGTYGLNYIRSVRKDGSPPEERFCEMVAAYYMGENLRERYAHLVAGPIGQALAEIVEGSHWLPMMGLWESKVDEDELWLVRHGPNVKRALAYWSLCRAGWAGRLKRCPTCQEPYLAKRRDSVRCSARCRPPRRPPGRPRSIPRSVAQARRRFLNRISQWRSGARRRLSQGKAERLRRAMDEDLEAVRQNRMTPEGFVKLWTERLETADRAGRFAVRLQSGAPG